MAQKTRNLLRKKSFLKQERNVTPISENDKYVIEQIVNYRKREQIGTHDENIQRTSPPLRFNDHLKFGGWGGSYSSSSSSSRTPGVLTGCL